MKLLTPRDAKKKHEYELNLRNKQLVAVKGLIKLEEKKLDLLRNEYKSTKKQMEKEFNEFCDDLTQKREELLKKFKQLKDKHGLTK